MTDTRPTSYAVCWEFQVEEAESPLEAARQAFDAFMRPGSIAHVFKVTAVEDVEPDDIDQAEGVESLHIEALYVVDIDRGRDSNIDGEPVTYPASKRERGRLAEEEDLRLIRKNNDDTPEMWGGSND